MVFRRAFQKLKEITGRGSGPTREHDTARDDIERLRVEIAQLEKVARALFNAVGAPGHLPPEELRLHVGSNTTPANFWAQGCNSARRVLEVFGTAPSGLVLDWGCGSGRTLNWLLHLEGWRKAYRGCDVDRKAIEWLRTHARCEVVLCNETPPLPYPAAHFSGVFAFSVLTHIRAEGHRSWYEELNRILAPGGRALLTTQGERVLESRAGDPSWKEPRSRFATEGHAFVPFEGHYKDACLVSERFTRRSVEGLFDVEEYKSAGYQNMDCFLLRKP